MQAVDTCKVKRRRLRFETLADLSRELGVVEAAYRTGTLRRLGNRETGAILDHLARSIRGSIDGMPELRNAAPWLLRLVGPLFKDKMLEQGLTPGRRFGTAAERALWDNSATFESGARNLREQIARLSGMQIAPDHRHPIFGRLTAAEWLKFHLRHAELHLGFLQP